MARRRSPEPSATAGDSTVPVELLDWDHPVWSDPRAFDELLDRVDPGRNHRPTPPRAHPGCRFDYAADVFAASRGLIDPERPNGYVVALARIGVRLAGVRRRLRPG